MGLINCKICNDMKNKGMGILNSYICKNCIDNISKTEIEDTINYEYNKSIIKEMWIDYIAQLKVQQ